MYLWENLRTQKRHLAEDFEMITFCGKAMYHHYGRPFVWESRGPVAEGSLGSARIVADDLCLNCARLAPAKYFSGAPRGLAGLVAV